MATSIRVKAVQTGVLHEVFAWGHSGISTGEFSPVSVPELEGKEIIKLASGLDHFVAVTADQIGNHEVWSWGGNSKGQLGNGTLKDSTKPCKIKELEGKFIERIVCGYRYTVAVVQTKKGDQEMYSWGGNEYGQLGIGTAGTNDRITKPTRVTGFGALKVEGLVCGAYFVLVICNTGKGDPHEVFAFGANDRGQLGIGNTINQASPVHVPELSGRFYERVACGYDYGIALTTVFKGGPQELISWGSNYNGELGAGLEVGFHERPVKIMELANKRIDRLACGVNHNIAVVCNSQGIHEVYTWGANQYGQLGIGNTTRQNKPVRVNIPVKYIERLVCGVSHTMAVCSNGGEERMVYIWGFSLSELVKQANGGGGHQLVPAQLGDVDTRYMEGLLYGDDHTIAIINENPPQWIYMWGGHSNKQLGIGHIVTEPGKVENITEGFYEQLDCGAFHTVAVWHNGKGGPQSLFAWGYNAHGQLGIGNNLVHPKPVRIPDINRRCVEAIACGYDHTLAVASEGPGTLQTLYAWGSNYYGQVGNGSKIDALRPVVLSEFEGQQIEQVVAGGYHNMVVCLEKNGRQSLYGWGFNHYGQIGIGSCGGAIRSRIKVSGMEGKAVEVVTCGYNHTMAVVSDGRGGPQEVMVWGMNKYGQLGLGPQTANVDTPTILPYFNGKRILFAGCGGYYSVIVCTKGAPDAPHEVYAWGQNLYGQLGNGDTENRTRPTRIDALNGFEIFSLICGAQHVFVTVKQGQHGDKPDVYGWGYNSNGQLGIGTTVNQLKPIKITTLDKMKVDLLAAGVSHTAAAAVDLTKK
eukprot:NODE_567_length_2587_cov_49.829545_g486_i0.p1 GENE.NODE_567_length_2587_cov_49.829545_g486_i0~~NODE_567_length_2587_cov_49.829545_g486_i0.p1  ORF type:complete len:806 (-),score=198.91 NODE_567_length_2587_cov_49.829545_g486_i0:116-2533(-)